MGGAFSYVPISGTSPYAGADAFTYRLTDSAGQTAVATVNLNVVNTAPWSVGVLRKVHHGTTLSSASSQLVAASGDAESHALSFALVGSPSHGTLSLQSNGAFEYIPNAGYSGLDSFTYRASDGITNGNVASVTIDVSNEAPSLISNSWRTGSGKVLTVGGTGIKATAADADGDVLAVTVTQTTAHGTLDVNFDGTFVYTPNAGFSGRDTFRAKVNDGAAESSDIVFVIDVENATPSATGSTATLRHGTSAPLNLAAWDSDGDSLIYELVTAPAHGNLSYSNLVSGGSNGVPSRFTGGISFTPASGFAGTDQLTFRVFDGVAYSDAATVRINVLNSSPTARPSWHSIDAGNSLAVQAPGLLGQAIDADGDPLTLQIVTQPAHGALTLLQSSGNANGGFTFVPTAGYAGVDSFTWRVYDGVTWSDNVTTTIGVNNSAPVLRDRQFRSTYSTGIIQASGNRRYSYSLATGQTAFDLDNDPVTYQLITNGTHGLAVVEPSGAITYTPSTATFTGNDQFTVRGFDGYSWSEAVAISVTIDNEAPLAISDSFTTHHHTNLTFSATDLLKNDYDFDGDTMQVVSVSVGNQGTLTQNGNTWTYSPGSFVGTASLTYVVSDGLVHSEPATIEIEVTNAPVWGISRTFSVQENGALEFEISTENGAVTSPDGDDITVSITSQPTHGSVTALGNHRFRYIPTAGTYPARGFMGTDQLTFVVSDGVMQSSLMTYSFTVVDPRATATGTHDQALQTTPESQIPQLVSPAPSRGADRMPNTPVDLRQIRPGTSTTGQLALGDGVVSHVWNGSSWQPLGAGIASVSFGNAGSIQMTPGGSYSINVTTDIQNGQMNLPVRVTNAYGSVDGHLTAFVRNTAPVLGTVSTFGNAWKAVQPASGPRSITESSSLVGTAASLSHDAEGDTIAFDVQTLVGSYGNLIVQSDGTFTYVPTAASGQTPPETSVSESFTITARDAFGGLSTGTVHVAAGMEYTHDTLQIPAGQQHTPNPGSGEGVFIASGVTCGSITGANDGGVPSLSFVLMGNGQGTYGQLQLSGSGEFKYTIYAGQEEAFLAAGKEPTMFRYKAINGAGEWAPGEITIRAKTISNGQSVSWNNDTVISDNDPVSVLISGRIFARSASGASVVSLRVNPNGTTRGSDLSWYGSPTTRLYIDTRADILTTISAPGVVSIRTWQGSVRNPVIASRIERLLALGGSYHSAFAGAIDLVEQHSDPASSGGSQSTGLLVGASIGTVIWTDRGASPSVTWNAPIIGGSINAVRITGNLSSPIISGGELNGISVSQALNAIVIAGGRMGYGPDYDYYTSQGQGTPPGSNMDRNYWDSPAGVIAASISGLIAAGSHLNYVRAISGNLNGILTVGGNLGVVRAENGFVNSMIVAGGHVNEVSGKAEVRGLVKAGTSVGHVFSEGDVVAQVTAGTDIASVVSWRNVTGRISAQGGTITRISAGIAGDTTTGRTAMGGSVLSGSIEAGKAIGTISAIHEESAGSLLGGQIQSGRIEARGDYIARISASRDIQAPMKAYGDVMVVMAGTDVVGGIESENGSIGTVTGRTIEGEIKANKNIGTVTAALDRLGQTTSTTGAIAAVTATRGKIDGEINGLLGIGDVTAGTDIAKEITAAGAGASIGNVRAGAFTSGNLKGSITTSGNIASVFASAVTVDDLPTVSEFTKSWTFALSEDNTPVKPERLQLRQGLPYADGNIVGGIYAGGSIYEVIAHGQIRLYVRADGAIPSVLAYKTITASITSGSGATNVTTYGALTGEVTVVGNLTSWAYDDITKKQESSDGAVRVETWGKMLGSALGKTPAVVHSYGAIENDQIKSRTGNAIVTSFDSVKSNIEAQLNAATLAIGDVLGKQSAEMQKTFGVSAANWEADSEAGKDSLHVVLNAMRGRIIANKGDAVVRLTRQLTSDVTGDVNVFLYVRDSISGSKIVAKSGSAYVDAGSIVNAHINAPKGAVGLNIYGGMSLSHTLSKDSTKVFARSGMIGVSLTSKEGAIRAFTTGHFLGHVEAKGQGDAEIQSWDGLDGDIEATSANAKVLTYGEMTAKVHAGKGISAAVWGETKGDLEAGTQLSVFSRNSVTGRMQGGCGPLTIVTGESVTNLVTTNLESVDPAWTVSITAFGDITGAVRGSGSITVSADNIRSPEVESKGSSVSLTAIHKMESKVKALSDITITAGELINIPSATPGSGTVADVSEKGLRESAGVVSTGGSVGLYTSGSIHKAGVAAFGALNVSAASAIAGLKAVAGAASTVVSLGTIQDSHVLTTAGEISAFAGESADFSLTAVNGDVSVTAVEDLSGSFAGNREVYVVSFGSVTDLAANGDRVLVFGLQNVAATITGLTIAVAESAFSVTGSIDAGSSQVFAGLDAVVAVTSRQFSYVSAGTDIGGSVESDGRAVAVSQGRGKSPGSVTAKVEGDQEAKAIAVGGSVTGKVKSKSGMALAFAGENISGGVEAGTNAGAFAVGSITGSEIKGHAATKAFALGTISAPINGEKGYALALAGQSITGTVHAAQNAVAVSLSGMVTQSVTSDAGSAVVIAMDGISGAITGHRHAIALAYGVVAAPVTANNGTALVVSIAGGVTKDVSAGMHAIVVAFGSVEGKIDADGSILVASLGNVTGEIDAGQFATVLSAGNVAGGAVVAGKSAIVAALGNVSSSIKAEDGNLIIITLASVTSTLTATGFVVVLAAGDVRASVPRSQDIIVISGGTTEFKFFTSQQQADATSAFPGLGAATPAAAANRDLVLFGLGGVKGSVHSGRDAILVSMGTSTGNVTAGGDAIVYAFDGVQRASDNVIPIISGGKDAILISAASALARVTAGENAMLLSLGNASGSRVSGGNYAAALTFGGGTDLTVDGNLGALAWTYGDFAGHVTATAGNAMLSTIGSAANTVVHGKLSAVAATVGAFQGSVTADEEYAGIFAMLGASGQLSAGLGALLVSDASLAFQATANEDLLIWSRNDVHGSYSTGRDAVVIAHGTFDASLSAARDILFAYAGTSLRGSLTAGRWIGDGSTSAPTDSTMIDDIFSHGDILAQILAGTATSNDPDKGRIGTIASIGNTGGSFTGSRINRVRSGSLVTASINSGSTSFIGDNGGSGTGNVIVLQNQANLLTNIPKPVLPASERSRLLADAATALTDILKSRSDAAGAIDEARTAIEDDREETLEEQSKARANSVAESDLIMSLADTGIIAAKYFATSSLARMRADSEQAIRQTEQNYLKILTEIVGLRDRMRMNSAESQQVLFKGLADAVALLKTSGDPAVERLRDSIVNYGEFQNAEFQIMFDARAEVLAKQFFGDAWQDYIEHYEDASLLTHLLETLRVVGNASGNALIDTGWGFVTLGFGGQWNAFDTSGEGYQRSYIIMRVTSELALGFGVGAAASAPGKLGKAAFAIDMAGNGMAAIRGGYGVAKDGKLDFEDGAELAGGLFGIGGGILGKLSRSGKSVDDIAEGLADGSSGVDDLAESAGDVAQNAGKSGPTGCFLAGQVVHVLVAMDHNKGNGTPAAAVTAMVVPPGRNGSDAFWKLMTLASAAALLSLLASQKRRENLRLKMSMVEK